MATASPRGVRLARGAVGVLALGVAGEVVGRAGIVDRSYLPPTSTVLARLGELLVDPDFLDEVLVTARTWLLGLLIATAIAVPAGLVLGSLPGVNAATRVVIEFLRPVPSVALVPLGLVLFGLGIEMRLLVVVFGSVWPILFNTVYALMATDPVARDTARSFGLSRPAILLRVALPGAAPFIATGIRVAAAIALILEISAELFGGGGIGIGGVIVLASSGVGQMDVVLAGAVVAGALGYLANDGLERASRRVFGWQQTTGATG